MTRDPLGVQRNVGNTRLRWGMLGTGRIARIFAAANQASRTGVLSAVASRSADTASTFARAYGIARAYSSYAELLSDDEVDAVYISLPNHLHGRYSIAASQAGKHVLCEKPLTITAVEAEEVIDTVRGNGTFLMEAFMYRCHPQIAKLVELLRQRAIGQVRHMEARFSFDGGDMVGNYRTDVAMGGGGILDVGCYCVSAARLVAGVALGKLFEEPIEISGTGCFDGPGGVDLWATAGLKFPGAITAQLLCGIKLASDNLLQVYGTSGTIRLRDPWFARQPAIEIYRSQTKDWETLSIPEASSNYQLEADLVAEHFQSGESPFPAMGWDDSLGNMRALESWRNVISRPDQ